MEPQQATGLPSVITCRVCRRTSANPSDVEHGYCGHCHDFTGTPRALDDLAAVTVPVLGGRVTLAHIEQLLVHAASAGAPRTTEVFFGGGAAQHTAEIAARWIDRERAYREPLQAAESSPAAESGDEP